MRRFFLRNDDILLRPVATSKVLDKELRAFFRAVFQQNSSVLHQIGISLFLLAPERW
jgi:hypothetical protein